MKVLCSLNLNRMFLLNIRSNFNKWSKDAKLVINEKLIVQFTINRDGNVKQHYYRNENNDYDFITTVVRHVFYFRIHIAALPKNILSRKREKLNPLFTLDDFVKLFIIYYD